MVYANFLPPKHSSKIGFINAKLLYYIGKRITINASIAIQNEIVNQSQIVNLRINLPYGYVITELILALGVHHKIL